VARSRLVSPRELHELYQAQIANPLEHMDTSDGVSPEIARQSSHQIHTRRSASKHRVNIYSLSRPPIYQPSLVDLGVIFSCIRPATSASREQVSNAVETESMFALAHAADGKRLTLAKTSPPGKNRRGVLDLDQVKDVAMEIGSSMFRPQGIHGLLAT